MSPSFAYPDDRIEYWGPMWTLRPSIRPGAEPGTNDEARLYNVVGRLRPGVSVEEAEADLVAITGGQWGVRARPLREMLFGWATAPLATVQAAVALVSLMACANVAAIGVYGVTSCAVTQRLREIAVRIALGAHARDVAGAVARQALAIVSVGLGGGVAAAACFVPVRRALRTDPVSVLKAE